MLTPDRGEASTIETVTITPKSIPVNCENLGWLETNKTISINAKDMRNFAIKTIAKSLEIAFARMEVGEKIIVPNIPTNIMNIPNLRALLEYSRQRSRSAFSMILAVSPRTQESIED